MWRKLPVCVCSRDFLASRRLTPRFDVSSFWPPACQRRHPHPAGPPLLECPLLECPLLECPVLEYPVLEYPLLECPVLEYPVLEYPVLEYPLLECQVQEDRFQQRLADWL